MSKSRGYIDFAAVKSATTLEQVLQHYGLMESFRPSGGGLRGCCPLHKGDDPTEFSVTLSRNLWKCFSVCPSGGNHMDFVVTMEKCSLQDAAWKMNDWFNLGLEPKASERYRKGSLVARNESTVATPAKANHGQQHQLAPPAEAPPDVETGENESKDFFALTNLDTTHPYLAERSLRAETIAHFGIGYCSKGIMAGRIAIPIHNASGQIVANAGRWPGTPEDGKEKYRLPGKFKKTLEVFNYHRAALEPDTTPLVIVEGFFGVMHLWQLGIRRVVALMGWHLSIRQEELITKLVSPDSRIVLMLDNDEVGNEARQKIAPRLAQHCFVRSFRWPEGIQQPDELTAEQVAELTAL